MSSAGLETDWLKKWAHYSPAKTALQDADSGVQYGYGFLYYLSCRLATHLRDHFDINAGARVAALATNEIEYVPLFFACQRIGAILVPVNFRLAGREIDHILADSGADLLIAQDAFKETVEKLGPQTVPDKRWSFDGDSHSLRAFARTCAVEFAQTSSLRSSAPRSWEVSMSAGFDDPAMILYTSGTTGAPKGALITQKMMFWNSVNTGLRLNLTENDSYVSFLPFFHTAGWNVMTTPLLHRGARVILLKKFEPDRVLELCERERTTVMFGVPTTMDMMAHTSGFSTRDLSSVRYAIVGGEPMPIELIKTWQDKGVPIRQGFGMTEFGPNVFSLPEEDSIRKAGSIGFPNFYVDVRVVDDSGHDCVAGEIGELLLRGPVCTPGYWRNESATRETIQDGWLRSGDLVRFDDEGYYYVAGRKKDMYISGGENVYPVEIERYLSTHPKIREVAVLGVSDEKWGEVGKAFIALASEASLTSDEVIAFCQGHLAKYKIPKHIEFRTELPKGDSGKILKRLLKN
jgi:fatty-acyl-CoA synthase